MSCINPQTTTKMMAYWLAQKDQRGTRRSTWTILTSLMTLVYLSPPLQGLKCNWLIL